MAVSKTKKAEILKDLQERVLVSPAIVFVNFHGLSVAKATDLRKSLRSQSVGFTVAKKTLIQKALVGKTVAGTLPALDGEIALAYAAPAQTDALQPAKGIYEFEKKNKEALRILGGVYEGAYVDAVMMTALAAIPGREILYGRLVNLLNSPFQRLVWALGAASRKKS